MRLFEGTVFDRPPHCERCETPESECECPVVVEEPQWRDPASQTAKLSVEKRRKGKIVTVVRGLKSDESNLEELLKNLKGICGAGGTLQQDTMEIQGNQLDRVRETLSRLGYRVKG